MIALPQWAVLVIRVVIFALGRMVETGTLPTGVDGLGELIGPYVQAFSLAIAAGQPNKK